MLCALIWDVDGTLAETERDGHRVAFNQAFEQAGLPWRWSEARYGELLAVAGGRERLLHDMAGRADAPAGWAQRESLARALHGLKNAAYARIVSSGRLPLRPGVRELLDDCAAAGVRLAIATTTGTANVQGLLQAQLGPQGAQRFECMVCAEQAPRKKPDPQVYRLALQQLGCAPHEVLALEDSPAGLRAAAACGIATVITRSVYFADAFQTPPVRPLAIGPSLGEREGWQPVVPGPGRVNLALLRDWHDSGLQNMSACA